MCHMSLFVALEASSSSLVVLFFSFSVCTLDLKVERIDIHWDYLVIRMSILLLMLWFWLLCSFYPLEFGRSRMFDGLMMLILLNFYVGILNVFFYSGWLLILMKDSILKVVFYAHYEKLNCSWMCEVKLCLFSNVFECYNIVIKLVLLHVQVIEYAHCLLFLGDIEEVGIEGHEFCS